MDEEFERHQWPLHQDAKKNCLVESEGLLSNLLCMKSYTLINYISEYPREADLKWSLFCAACNSYRFDSVLKPFPPFFLSDSENKDIDRLVSILFALFYLVSF